MSLDSRVALEDSQVTGEPAWSRERAVSSVRPILWRYLRQSAQMLHAAQRPVPTRDLDRLDRSDLLRLTAAHAVASDEARQAVQIADGIVRRMPPRVNRDVDVSSGVIRGKVDWTRTIQSRIAAGDPTLFAAITTERRYDTPLARLLRAALLGLRDLARHSGLIAPTQTDATRTSLGSYVGGLDAACERILGHPKMRQSTTRTRVNWKEFRAAVARNPDAAPLLAVVQLHDRVMRGGRDDLERLMERQVFAPLADDVVFELQAAVAILEYFGSQGFSLAGPLLLIADGAADDSPLAVLRRDAQELTIWWQRSSMRLMNMSSESSSWRLALASNGLSPLSSLRPDFTLCASWRSDWTLVECKHTSKGDGTTHDRRGILDILAYLADLDAAAGGHAKADGLVIAWNSAAVPSLPPSRVKVSGLASLPLALASWSNEP